MKGLPGNFQEGAFLKSPFVIYFFPFYFIHSFPAWGHLFDLPGCSPGVLSFQPSGPASRRRPLVDSLNTPLIGGRRPTLLSIKVGEKAAAGQNGGGFSRCLQTPWGCDGRWCLRCWQNSCSLGLGTWGLSLEPVVRCGCRSRWRLWGMAALPGEAFMAHSLESSPRLRRASPLYIVSVTGCIFILCVPFKIGLWWLFGAFAF